MYHDFYRMVEKQIGGRASGSPDETNVCVICWFREESMRAYRMKVTNDSLPSKINLAVLRTKYRLEE